MLQKQTATIGAIELTANDLVNVNKVQLEHGMGSDGLPLTDLSPEFELPEVGKYLPYKVAKNPLSQGRYDMNYSGYSYDTMYMREEGRGNIIIDGEGWAKEYDLGNVTFAQDLRGRIFGIYPSDALTTYQHTILYPMSISIVKAETGL